LLLGALPSQANGPIDLASPDVAEKALI